MKPTIGLAFFTRLKVSGLVVLSGGIFVLHVVYCMLLGYRSPLPFDAGVYWGISADFYRNAHFSLLTFDNGLRGYVYPLLLFVPRLLTDATGGKPIYTAILLGAACAAGAFGYVFPAVYQRINPNAAFTMKRRIAFALLGFVFWRGYFNYTLSDFPALLFLAISVLYITRHKHSADHFLAGLFLAAAINTRSVYIITMPLLALVLWVQTQKSYVVRGKFLLLFVAGTAVVFIPQSMINSHNHTSRSFLAQNKVSDLGITDLYLAQLEWGISYQKYETSLGGLYPDVKILFLDPVGQTVLDAYHLPGNRIQTQQLKSYAEYGALVADNIWPMLAIYGRHLFNMLDVHHATPYIRNIYEYNLLLAVLNYTVWFAAGLLLLYKKREWSFVKVLFLSALLLPCVVALPMAVECRFALPAHLLAYAMVSFSWPQHWQWNSLLRAQKIKLVGAYAAFLLCCIALSLQTYATLEFGKALLWY